jgi:hypothetical protein
MSEYIKKQKDLIKQSNYENQVTRIARKINSKRKNKKAEINEMEIRKYKYQ